MGNSTVGLLLSLLVVCAVCSCGKNPPKNVTDILPGAIANENVPVENRLQQLLGRLNVRQNEVATLRRVADPGMTGEQREQARAVRYASYSAEKYIAALRAAGAAIQNRMAGLEAERAILESAVVPPATNQPPTVTNAPPDERGEEMNLKARLVELEMQREDLAHTEPPAGRVAPQLQEKAAAARDELSPPGQYAESLGVTVELLESKLRGLDAEAGFLESLLGLNSTAHGKR